VTARTDLALVAVALVWGSSHLAAQEVVTPESVFAILVLRFMFAALGLAALLASRQHPVSGEETSRHGVRRRSTLPR
jgi:drug/metabolite transporter (DMT)-like permease